MIVCGYLHGQSSIYIIGEFPSVFSAVENQVKDGEIDSVLVICDQILNGNDDENIRGIAVFYKGQAEELKQQNLQFEIYYQDAIKRPFKCQHALQLVNQLCKETSASSSYNRCV